MSPASSRSSRLVGRPLAVRSDTSEMAGVIEARQRLDAQQAENESVLKVSLESRQLKVWLL